MNDLSIGPLQACFESQRARTRAEPIPPWDVRADRLRRLRGLVQRHRQAFGAAIRDDFGNRSLHETDLLEVFPSVKGIDHALASGQRWMRSRRVPVSWIFKPGQASVLPQPLGVVGIIVPWNYPLYLAVGPLTAALAAGNRAMVKLSEFTPRFGDLFQRAAGEAFAEDELAVFNGDVDTARAFTALPFDHLLFTGSTAVGHHVMRAASEHLVPVTLELGGKSPAIIGPGADLAHAAERIMAGKLMNAGQTCIAPDYVLLPADRQAAFLDAARRVVARMYPRIGATPDFTSIVTDRQFGRLASLVDEARAHGATVVPLSDAPVDPARRLMPPVALTGVPEGSRALTEEIFGPVLPVVPYRSLDEALAFVNARPRPLALYVFDRDRDTIDRTLAGTTAGGVTVNDTLLHIAQEELPFGGVGPSGMGSYHGEAGFRTFSHAKPVFRQSRFNGAALLSPPYGPRFERMLRFLLGR